MKVQMQVKPKTLFEGIDFLRSLLSNLNKQNLTELFLVILASAVLLQYTRVADTQKTDDVLR